MSMMNLYTLERVEEALSDSIETKNKFIEEIEALDTYIFILKYYIATGVALDPTALGIDDPEGDPDD